MKLFFAVSAVALLASCAPPTPEEKVQSAMIESVVKDCLAKGQAECAGLLLVDRKTQEVYLVDTVVPIGGCRVIATETLQARLGSNRGFSEWEMAIPEYDITRWNTLAILYMRQCYDPPNNKKGSG